MTELAQLTITVGNNTNVTATTVNLTEEQQQKLRELQKIVPGDISISADGIVSITSQKGLALFNNFCQTNNISNSSSGILQIPPATASSLQLEGLKSASNFCASFGNGEMDPSKMSFTELTTLMFMMSYSSEEERHRALANVKGTQNEVAMKISVDTWAASREAADKTCSAETFQAWGTIASGIASGTAAIGGAAYSMKATSGQKQLNENNDKLTKNQLLNDQKNLQRQLGLSDTTQESIDTKRTEIGQKIEAKEAEIKAKEAEIKSKLDEHVDDNGDVVDGEGGKSRQEAIKAKDEEIKSKLDEHVDDNGDVVDGEGGTVTSRKDAIEANDKAIEANDKAIEAKRADISKVDREIKEANTTEPKDDAKISELNAHKSELNEELKTLNGEQTQLAEKRSNLCKELDPLYETKTKLEKPIGQLQADMGGLQREMKIQQTQLGQLEQLTGVQDGLKKLEGVNVGDGLTEGQIKELESQNAKIQTEIRTHETRGKAFTDLGPSIGSILKGSSDMVAAVYKREAAFVDAEVRVMDAYRGVVQSQIQNFNDSINSTNQNMQKTANNLKQIVDESYGVMGNITHNI
ncbi:MAG: hypothetical protein LBB16_01095 [Puniceicoccales bacterium]|jgi:predicted  nucleic acid-binding Zn-ribbon protein|nr:hypothetical protein [Puniceicoccales bacterium]